MEQQQETLSECIERLGLSVRSEFVPFSQSRNAKEQHKTLNWRVTLVKRWINGAGDARFADIVTTDYSAGIAHCPAYNKKWADKWAKANAIALECEKGRPAKAGFGSTVYEQRAPHIQPKAEDVIYSLIMDSDVLDYPSIEEWAGDLGYNPDSRKDESIYRACIEIALKLRAALGESALSELRLSAQDY